MQSIRKVFPNGVNLCKEQFGINGQKLHFLSKTFLGQRIGGTSLFFFFFFDNGRGAPQSPSLGETVLYEWTFLKNKEVQTVEPVQMKI